MRCLKEKKKSSILVKVNMTPKTRRPKPKSNLMNNVLTYVVFMVSFLLYGCFLVVGIFVVRDIQMNINKTRHETRHF